MHEMEKSWNEYIRCLLRAERLWDKFRERQANVKSREELSIPGQRVQGMATSRAAHMVALPRLLDLARRNGGLQSLLVPGEEKKEKKEPLTE